MMKPNNGVEECENEWASLAKAMKKKTRKRVSQKQKKSMPSRQSYLLRNIPHLFKI